MSRSDAEKTSQTAKAQNAQEYANSQNAYTLAQKDAGDYEKSLSEYAAANPYSEGGAFQADTNKALANTADAAGAAAGQAMQSQASRTGINAGGAIAGTEAAQEADERGLGADEAKANQERLAAGAGYGQNVLAGKGAGESMEQNLAAGQSAAASGDINAENAANAQNQSFMDQFGGAFANGLGQVASGSNVSFTKAF